MGGEGFDPRPGEIIWGLIIVALFVNYAGITIRGKLYFRGGSAISGLPARLIGIAGTVLIGLTILNVYIFEPNGKGLNWLFPAYIVFGIAHFIAWGFYAKSPTVVLKVRNVPQALLIAIVGVAAGAGCGVLYINSANALSLLEWVISIGVSLCVGIGIVMLLGRGPAESVSKQLMAGWIFGMAAGVVSGGIVSWLL